MPTLTAFLRGHVGTKKETKKLSYFLLLTEKYMTLKSFLYALILVAISSTIAFVAGQSYKHLQTVANLTTSIDGLREDLRALEKELAKQTGIKLPVNRQDTAGQKGLAQAEARLQQGSLAMAGLYFSNAISQDPGNWSVLQRYSSSHLINYQNCV
jgi:hypothetical protein